MKVIIAGTRTYDNYEDLRYVCDVSIEQLKCTEVEIVIGCAEGADKLGEKYAAERGYKVTKFPANWSLHGKAAGPIRNREMAEYADVLIAFWDGVSKGTGNMIKEAEERRLSSFVHYIEPYTKGMNIRWRNYNFKKSNNV